MDVLIYTEVDNRETDAACLIQAELRRRGYSVVVERYNRICEAGNMLLYNPKVLILPWLYGEDFLFNFVNNNKKGKLKIINMQSEQILSENFIKNSYHMPKGECKSQYHLAWGEITRERFIKNGIKKSHILECGNINMDFNSVQFINVYETKEEIAKKYSLMPNKQWCLFASSFTHAAMNEKERNQYIKNFPFLKEFVEISIESQKQIVKWFTVFAETHEDIELIYRPHPVEQRSKLIEKLKKIKNIHVISDLSIRQWVHVCDINLTWFSTSIADVYFQNKNCAVLRPIPIPHVADCELFYDCKSISSYEQFLDYMKDDSQYMFPISSERMEQYYGKIPCGRSYIAFCDKIEQIILNKTKNRPLRINVNYLSRIHRNTISCVFHLNKVIRMSKFIPQKDSFYREQLDEKWRSRKSYKEYVNNLSDSLFNILKNVSKTEL